MFKLIWCVMVLMDCIIKCEDSRRLATLDGSSQSFRGSSEAGK